MELGVALTSKLCFSDPTRSVLQNPEAKSLLHTLVLIFKAGYTFILRWLQADIADFRRVWPQGEAWGSV